MQFSKRSVSFYIDRLGFVPVMGSGGAALISRVIHDLYGFLLGFVEILFQITIAAPKLSF